jgi:hypothetical protein
MDLRSVEDAQGGHPPIAVSVKEASRLSGLGVTSIWAFLRDGRLEAVRVRGVRRTLISYSSLVRLLAPPCSLPTQPRRRGRPRKAPADEASS